MAGQRKEPWSNKFSLQPKRRENANEQAVFSRGIRRQLARVKRQNPAEFDRQISNLG